MKKIMLKKGERKVLCQMTGTVNTQTYFRLSLRQLSRTKAQILTPIVVRAYAGE
jgi:hypothetical protein